MKWIQEEEDLSTMNNLMSVNLNLKNKWNTILENFYY